MDASLASLSYSLVSLLRSEDAGAFGKNILEEGNVLHFVCPPLNRNGQFTLQMVPKSWTGQSLQSRCFFCEIVGACVDVLSLHDLRLIKSRVASSRKAATKTWRYAWELW